MRNIKVPADVTVQPTPEDQRKFEAARAAGGSAVAQPHEVYSFKRFAFAVWLEDTRASTAGDRFSLAMQRRWGKVIDKFEAACAGDTISLDDQDWSTLCKIVETPSAMVAPSAMRQLFVFSDAVLEAKGA